MGSLLAFSPTQAELVSGTSPQTAASCAQVEIILLSKVRECTVCHTHSDLAGFIESRHPVPHVGYIVGL